jgi:hypothetical protein
MKSQKIYWPTTALSFVDSEIKKYFYRERNEKDPDTLEQSFNGQ